MALAYTPNDPLTRDQWAWGEIDAYGAWDVTRGAPRVAIAIIDTGVNTAHEDFRYPYLHVTAKIVAPYDFIENDTTPQNQDGHGTLVAGVATAVMNNHRGGTVLCPNCSLMPIRVNSSGNGLN